MSLEERNVYPHKNGPSKNGITVAPHRIIAAVFVPEDIFPVEHIRDPKIEHDKSLVEIDVFAAVDIHSLV